MDGNPKQQVAEKLRNSSSVLVSVSNNPSVDQLSSALGLSLMLNKLGKHTTTVYSGKLPNAIQFLNPERTFDSTVDGLRDFIISLDKEKADKLRYKVEDDVVKIFITPYKSKISEDDLVFTQGDFNVDLVVALGVHTRGDLDKAITSHGRILHDATIITINNVEDQNGDLGNIDWTDANASCLAEMLVSISEALEGGILDEQMSTAFLTGIVSATDRFKNTNTSPKVMTMAAQLMAAGANQQLIASNLQQPSSDGKKRGDKKGSDVDSFAEEDETLSIDRNRRAKKPGEIDDDDILDDIEANVHAHHLKLDERGRTKRINPDDPAIKKLEDELSRDSESNLIELEDRFKQASTEEKPEEKAPFTPPPLPDSQDGDGTPQSRRDEVTLQPLERPNNINNVRAVGMPMQDQRPQMSGAFNASSSQPGYGSAPPPPQAFNNDLLQHVNPNQQQNQNQQNRNTADDLPSSESLMHDLEEARRQVEEAMNESQFKPAGHPIQALNAVPMDMDQSGTSQDIQFSHDDQYQMPPQGGQFGPPPSPYDQPPPMMGPPPIPGGQMPMSAPMQQMPGNDMNQMGAFPQQPIQSPQSMNPLFGGTGNSPQPPIGPDQNSGPFGSGPGIPPVGPNPPTSAPPLPPIQPPPMPPFN